MIPAPIVPVVSMSELILIPVDPHWTHWVATSDAAPSSRDQTRCGLRGYG